MRTLFDRPFYRITTWRSAGVALWSQTDYQAHKTHHLPGRRSGLPGEKFLWWTHHENISTPWVPITRAAARAAGTTVQSLMKAYPSSWYTVRDGGVWVRFPEEIRYGADLIDERLAS